MPDIFLDSYAEKRAQAATKYEGFGVSLPEIKRTTAELLSQIGKNGIFAEYSKHDITHIDEVIAQDQAATYAASQLRNVTGDLGEEFTEGQAEFLDALRTGPLPTFNTSVWSNRHFDLN